MSEFPTAHIAFIPTKSIAFTLVVFFDFYFSFAGFLNGGMAPYNWVVDVNGVPRRADGRCLTDVFTRLATGFVKRHKDEPFFLYYAVGAGHSPHQVEPEWIEKYAGRFDDALLRRAFVAK